MYKRNIVLLLKKASVCSSVKANGERTRRVVDKINSERANLGTFVVARTLTSETVASRRRRGAAYE